MEAFKLDDAANTDGIKEEKPAVHFHTDAVDAIERSIIGDAAKAEKPEMWSLGLPPAHHHGASLDGQSAIIDNLLPVTLVDPIVIAPMKMETGEPLETADSVCATTIGSRDEWEYEMDEPTTSGVMAMPQRSQPHPHPGVSLGPDQAGSEVHNVQFVPRIHSPRLNSREEDQCNTYTTLWDEGPQENNSKLPPTKQIDKNPSQCTVCFKSFSRPSGIQMHMRTHTGEKPHQCTVCSKSFSVSAYLKKHMQTHTGEKTYQCTVCSKSFCQAYDLKLHMRTHTGEKPYQCIVCLKSYTMSSTLKLHIRTHTGEKPHQCAGCSESFSRPTALKVHMRTHTGEKPHQCTVCSKSFSQSSALKLHMRTHTGEKPYQCAWCSKSFCRPDYLNTHVRIHTGEKPHQCVWCSKSFCRPDHLNTHMRIHTGEKQ